MPAYSISDDTKFHIPVLFQEGHSINEICSLLGVKKSLVYKTLRFYKNFGTIHNPHTYSHAIGRPRILGSADILFIRNVIQQDNTIYLDEIQTELLEKRRVYATLSTISHALQRLHFTRKVMSFSAAEQNDELQALYMNYIGAEAPDANMLLFIDEAAKDRRTSTRPCGRSLRGQRCYGLRYFICGVRYSILPAITLDGVITYNIIEGPVNNAHFV
jgi:transposase